MSKFSFNFTSVDGETKDIPDTHSTYKKLVVQWLYVALCFVSSSVVADSFRLRKRQLLVAAKPLGAILPNHRHLTDNKKNDYLCN
jgi:hypothetical protein